MHDDIGVAEAIRVEDSKMIVFAPSDVAGSGVLAEETAGASDGNFNIGKVEDGAGRGF